MRLLLLPALLLLVSLARAQQPLVLHGKLPAPQLDLTPYTSFYEDISGDTLPLSVIQTKPFRPLIQKSDAADNSFDQSVIVTWLKFTLRNTHTDTLKLFYYVGQGHGQIMAFEGNKKIEVVGFDRILQRERPDRFTISLFLPPRSEHNFWIRIISSPGGNLPIDSKLSTVEAGWKLGLQRVRDLLPVIIVMISLAGCVLFMGTYALYQFHLTRDRAFFYYSLYAGFGLFHSIKMMDFQFGIGALMQFYPVTMLGYPFHHEIIAIFYALFLNQLLQIRTAFPRLWHVTILLMGIIALKQGIRLVETLRGWPLFTHFLFDRWAEAVSGGLLIFVLLLVIIGSRSPLRSYLLAGNGLLLGLGVLPLVIFPFTKDTVSPQYFIYTFFLLPMLGLTAELFCFAMALAYRSRLSEVEKQHLQQHHALELETQLARQAREIQQQSWELEAQHLKQVETEFERKLADTEMVALRAQMNPHFIFNCLNSIKLYTLQNNSEQASDYLSKFAKLIRLVLENSRSELVPLKNELEALQLYSELEAMRFKHKVNIRIVVSPDIDTQYIRIPPLLLQPYVENAIWHGLMHKQEGGMVKIQVYQPNEQLLLIEITDDGVGRAKAAQLKSKSTGQHKSFGLQVTADRIRMINHLYDTDTQVQIHDLVDGFGKPCGTKVVLEIPVN